MELGSRDKVHEIEFLSLLAFVARESLRVAQDMTLNSRFTQHDLALAYAYQKQRANSQFRHSPSSDQMSSSMQVRMISTHLDAPLAHYNPDSTKDVYMSQHSLHVFNMPASQSQDTITGTYCCI